MELWTGFMSMGRLSRTNVSQTEILKSLPDEYVRTCSYNQRDSGWRISSGYCGTFTKST